MQDQAAERRLDVRTRTAEPVVEIEMAERGVEVIAPKQADDAAAQPHTFRIAGRTVDGVLGFGKFIDFLVSLAAS